MIKKNVLKNSLILGEMQLVDGNIALHGSLGYCAQQAWIQNATIKGCFQLLDLIITELKSHMTS